MERRSRPRRAPDKPVHVTVFGDLACPLKGTVADLSEGGMRILVNGPMVVGDLARVDTGDDLVIAEVRHCSPQGKDFAIGLLVTNRIGKVVLRSFVDSFQMA